MTYRRIFCAIVFFAAAMAPSALRGQEAAAIPPVERAPFHIPVFRNDLVTMVGAALPAVRIVIDGGELIETRDGAQNMVLHAGDFHWRDAGAAGELRNAGEAPIDLVEFEIK